MSYQRYKELSEKLLEKESQKIQKICLQELHLPRFDDSIKKLLLSEYLPLYLWLKDIQKQKQTTAFLGIVGVNGVGKTTLTKFLEIMFLCDALEVVTFSMDDLYPAKKQRQEWADMIDPQLNTRLIYDPESVKEVFTALADWQGELAIPRFDKATDERKAEKEWTRVSKRPNIVIAEGVFIFAQPLKEKSGLTKTELFIDNIIAELYQCYTCLDLRVVLLTEKIEDVIRFRQQQEVKLQAEKGKDAGMTSEEIAAFIRYYEVYLKRYVWPLDKSKNINLALVFDAERRIVSCRSRP